MKRENELYPFRRHLRRCEFFGPGGREARADKCDCPFHVDGLYHGRRIRQSLRTTSRQLADRRFTALLRKLDEVRRSASVADESIGSGTPQTVSEAVDRFLKNHGEVNQSREFSGISSCASEHGASTEPKLKLLEAFWWGRKASQILSDVTIDVLEDFRRTRDNRTGDLESRVAGAEDLLRIFREP